MELCSRLVDAANRHLFQFLCTLSVPLGVITDFHSLVTLAALYAPSGGILVPFSALCRRRVPLPLILGTRFFGTPTRNCGHKTALVAVAEPGHVAVRHYPTTAGYKDLLIIDPERFQGGENGLFRTPASRTRFWTDVLCSLDLSFDLIADEVWVLSQERLSLMPDEHIHDLESRIAALCMEL